MTDLLLLANYRMFARNSTVEESDSLTYKLFVKKLNQYMKECNA